MDHVIFGIGNPLLDISSPVPHSLLDKYGLKPANACLANPEHIPLYEELVRDFKVEYIAGGAAQNTIRAAQWMLQVPGATTYTGCIGKDKFGDELKKAAEADGVHVPYLVDADTPTGTCAVLITDKDRSLVANLAAAQKFHVSHLESAPLQELINKAQVFYTTGFFVMVSIASVELLGKHATQHNKYFAVNISAPFIAEFYSEPLATAIFYADIVISNETEAEAYGKKHGIEGKLEDVAAKISALPKSNASRKRMVIITQGAHATLVYDGEKHHTFHPLKLDASKIVDTNGAGDSFVGGFLSQWVQGKGIEKSVEAGHYCASICIQTSGCKFSGKPSFN
eukprot:TRINITY_DN1353_c0_g1_i1.p1 TRINITY_DN1353_c0_g1~~TRINITY_DN1353_c0_g1_i1.p1  ORF type:complete len:339 (-),score=126.92 TRINITY_DN1353_c0_g1_i1:79-1095(-)